MPTPKLPHPETFRTIEAVSEGGDIFGPSALSGVLVYANIPTEPVKPVEPRTIPVNYVEKK